MKKMKWIIAIAFVIFFLSSCKAKEKLTLETFTHQINSSIPSVKKVDISASMKDENVIVYKQEKNITIKSSENGQIFGTVITTISTLGSNFQLNSNMTSDEFNISENSPFFQYNLKEEYLESFDLQKNEFQARIKKDKASEVFQGDISNKENVVLNIFLEDGKISKIVCNYLTTSSKMVDIEVLYTY